VNNKNEILNELKNLAPTLAGVSKQNCFNVPAGYFSQNMPKVSTVSNILDIEANQHKTDLMYLDLMSEILADNFADIANVKTFKVPGNYFEELTEDIVAFKNSMLAINNIEGSITLDTAFQTNKYAVPENYFETLHENISNKAKSENDAELDVDLVRQLNKKVFAIPGNYFETLHENISNKVSTPGKSGRIISLPVVRNVLAIAAILALFTMGAWFFSSDKAGNAPSINEQIAQLSATDIEAYITSNAHEFENELLVEDLIEEDSNDLFWQMELDMNELDYYLQNIEEYNLNI